MYMLTTLIAYGILWDGGSWTHMAVAHSYCYELLIWHSIINVITCMCVICPQTSGRGAIFYGAEKGHLEIVKLLVQDGANLSLKDKVSPG